LAKKVKNSEIKEKEEKEVKKKTLESPKKSSKEKVPRGEPQTMEELLAMSKVQGLRKGQLVEGVVTEIGSNSIFIDIGAKTEGVVLGKEFEREKDFIKNLKPGDKVKAYVGSVEDERGQILLSLRQAAVGFAWEKFAQMMKTKERVEVRGREVNKGGLIVDAPYGLQGFIPGSQIGSSWEGKIDSLINRKLLVEVIEVNQEQNRLVFSEKLVSDEEKLKKTAKAIGKLKIGDVFEAEVTQVAPFGVFVKIKTKEGEVEGLVHISEISWLKVDDLTQIYKPGDKVSVKVINLEGGRVQFSIKQLLPDPWEEMDKKFPVDFQTSGKVTRLASFGALVEIEKGIEGLIHISKIPPEYILQEGDKVSVYIESVDKKNRRISLGLVLKEKPVGYK